MPYAAYLASVSLRKIEAVHMQENVEPEHDNQGSSVSVTGTSLEITEQRQLEQEAQRVLEALLEMAQAMVEGATPERPDDQSPAGSLRPLMQRMARLTRAVVGCRRLGFMGVEPETERLYPLAVAGLSPDQEQQWWREQEQTDLHLSEGVDLSLVKRLRANEILLMDLTQPPYRDQPNPYGIRQVLVAPIVFASRLLGLLTMDYGGLDHFYTNEELSLVAAVSQLVALAIEQKHISREREEALARERMLSAAFQRTIQLIELAHDAVIVSDPQSRVQFWNQGAERLYGWTQIEALGQVTHTLLSTRFPTSFDEIQQDLFETGQWEGILEHERADGKQVMVESRQVLVRNADGSPEAILEINRDITDRERLSQEREEARASELAAREAANRMDEFLGIVSHELKTPLTSISGNLQLARRRLTSIGNEATAGDNLLLRKLEEVQTILSRAERQVGLQNRLVSDLVDVSRISVERLELHVEAIELVALVRDVVEDQRAAAPSRSIAFATTVLAVMVRADGERIGQVVNNYVSNALKYSAQDRPVMIRVDVQADYARVSVRDEGPGLSPEQQERIWERFYRVPEISVQAGSGVGLGLGLHICQKIIEEHGGQVGVESARGQGAAFWFTLPLDRTDEA